MSKKSGKQSGGAKQTAAAATPIATPRRERVENTCIDPGDAKKGEIEIVSEETVWENDTARLLVARVHLPNSNEFKEHFRLAHAEGKTDGVVVVPITADDRIVLIRQFRHPVRMWVRELPRGASEPGETPEKAAKRELKEEIGAEATELFPLGRVVTDSGQQVGHPYLVAARIRETGAAEPEESEAIDARFRYSYPELVAACERGEIIDSFTLAAVVRLRPHFETGKFVYRGSTRPA
jgi:8-oxo-dGTP pyrophosphatase MutT (NUDIX family)